MSPRRYHLCHRHPPKPPPRLATSVVTAVIPVVEIPLEAGRTRRRLVGEEEEEKGRKETPLIFVIAVTPAVEIPLSPRRRLVGEEEEKGRKGRRKEKVRRSLLEKGEGEGEEKEAADGGSIWDYGNACGGGLWWRYWFWRRWSG